MKVGDLVKDMSPEYFDQELIGAVGLIVEVCEKEGIEYYHVLFHDGEEWIRESHLEVVSESR